MSEDLTQPTQALIVRPRVLPTTAQFAIEQQMAWKLRNARGFLPNHFMVGDENERAGKILAAIEYGRAVGIEPMIALQNTQVIDGKVGASALLIGALLRKAGYLISDDTNDERSIVVVSKNGTSVQGEFSMQDAQRAQLVKPNSGWAKYPRDMMYARALTQAARRGAQDAVLGMAYTAEELGGIEEEIAGVPAVEGEVVPGVSEAAGSPPTAAVQPAPPAPSEEVPRVSNAAPTVAADAPTSTEQAAPDTATPPQTASVTPLAGPAFARRMGQGRSVGPTAKRQNVVTVEQGAEKPATVPEAPAPTTTSEPAVPSQQAAPGLIDEPVAVAPVDDGWGAQRELLRTAAAELAHVNAIIRNVVEHAIKGEPVEVVPPATPSALSDEGLARLIDRDYPGRTLANLDGEAIQNRLELVEASLAKKKALMLERGITEE